MILVKIVKNPFLHKNGFFNKRSSGKTLRLQNIHKFAKHTSKIQVHVIKHSLFLVYRYVTHQHSVLVLRERRRASYFFDERDLQHTHIKNQLKFTFYT
jgi:hypothetical protein